MINFNSEVEKLEKELNLSSWQYKGIDLWPILKVILLNSNLKLKTRNYSKISLMRMFFNSLFSFVRIIIIKPKKNYLHFGDGGFSFPEMYGKSYIPQFTPYKNTFSSYGIEGIYLERLFSTKRIEDFSFGVDFATFMLKVWAKILPANRIQLNNYQNLMKKLDDLGIEAKELNLKKISELARFLSVSSNFYLFLLKNLKPQFITFRCYYIRAKYPLIYAANRLSIPTIDIQHGIQKEHFAYSGWSRNNYNTMPSYFWVWTADEVNNIQSWNGKAFLGGNLMLENFKNPESLENNFYKYKVLNFLPREKNKILICLQWGLKDYNFLGDYLKAARDSFFLIRFHPQMDNEEKAKVYCALKNFSDECYEIEQSSKLPLYALMGQCDLHVTAYSSTVLEACEFGIPSIVFSSKAKNYFSNLLEKNELVFEQAVNLEKQINDLTSIKRKSNSLESQTVKDFLKLINV